nr:unnamed protein product [Leishmania braziliensis]
MIGDHGEAPEREAKCLKSGGKENGNRSGGGDVVAPWLEDHGLWSPSPPLSLVTPTRPARISLLTTTTTPVRLHAQHSRVEATAPTTTVVHSNVEEGNEARGSHAVLSPSQDEARDHDASVASPQRQQWTWNGEDEGNRRTPRPSSSVSSSVSLPAQAKAHSGAAVGDDRRDGGGEAVDRSPELHRADADSAPDDTENLSSTAPHPPPLQQQQQQQEASPLLPSLMPVVATARTQQAMLSLPAKQPSGAVSPALKSGPPSSQGVSQREIREPAKRLCNEVAAAPAVVAASARVTSTASPTSPSPQVWVSCAHSDLPARYRDVPGYYCTYCSYTVCTDCLPLTGLSGQSRVARITAPSSASSPAASASTVASEMDWLDAVIASPATAVRSSRAADGPHPVRAPAVVSYACESAGGGHEHTPQQRHLAEDTLPRDAAATSSSSTMVAPLRCHLCRRGDLVREEALLHEWSCEGPAPAARRHGGSSLVYDTANLYKYHHMRTQRETRLSSTAPLLAQVLAVFPATLSAGSCHRGEKTRADVWASSITQSPLQSRHRRGDAPRGAAGKSVALGRDPLPSAPPVTKRRLILTRLGAEASAAAADWRDGVALPQLDRCEEGGSFVFSVWNPRMETPLVWCAVNREAREETPTFHHHRRRSSSAGHHGCGALPPSSSVTPLLLWLCPPSLPGLPARAFRVVVPYGLYAFANTHALALYEASDIFKKATTQLAAAAGAGDGTNSVQLTLQAQLSSVKVVPADTLRTLLVVNVMHHIATTPRPLLRQWRELPPSDPSPTPEHHRPNRLPPVQQPASPNVVHSATSRSASRKRPRRSEGEAEEDEEGHLSTAPDAEASTPPPTADLEWPHGLASPELALCVDHLLHGRSVAVYGIGSKQFFLHHVAQSAQLKHLHVTTVDASLGRADGGVGNDNSRASTSAPGNLHGGAKRGRRSAGVGNGNGSGGGGTNAPGGVAAPAASLVRQLITVGSMLVNRLHSTALKAEVQLPEHNATTPRRRQERQQNTHQLSDQKPGAATRPAERAALAGEEARAPAVARDVTSAMQRALTTSRTAAMPVDVVDVDDALSSITASGNDEREGMLDALGKSRDSLRDAGLVTVTPVRGIVREVGQSPTARSTLATAAAALGMSTSNTSAWKSQHRHRGPPSPAVLTSTPSSQRGTQFGSVEELSPATPSLPLLSPVPAFFDVLQRTVTGSLEDDGAAGADDGNGDGDDAPPRSVCVELPEYAGHLHSLKLPPLPFTASSHRDGAASEVTWRAPAMRFASEAVRQLALKSVRRRQASRRCVRWVSLPSTTALVVLAEQMPLTASPTPVAPPRLHLSEAHQLRPGWLPPLLLVLHNIDMLNMEEAGLLMQLCAEFAYPHPHLQLLVSFDDPRWPLTPLAGALERMGMCAVQLRSLLLPRVHEMQYVSSIRLLTDSEAMAAGGAGSLGLKAMGHGAPTATGTGSLASAGSSSGAGGGSHLLCDTMRRVLFSLPPAFSSLLRILVDVQEEMGEGQKISVFLAKDRFEQHGIMVSQGRLKALLQELTSNRIAQYDVAEHALTVMQPRKLRKVLDEVEAQRDGAGAAAATVSSRSSGPRAS